MVMVTADSSARRLSPRAGELDAVLVHPLPERARVQEEEHHTAEGEHVATLYQQRRALGVETLAADPHAVARASVGDLPSVLALAQERVHLGHEDIGHDHVIATA